MCVCSHFGGGHPHPANEGTPILPDGRYPSFPRRYPHPVLTGGYPQSRSGWGVPSSQIRVGGTLTWEGGTPCPDLRRVTSPSRPGNGVPSPIQTWEGGTPHPGQVPGRGVPPTGTALRVLATQQAVSLLRSCRRTFLFALYPPMWKPIKTEFASMSLISLQKLNESNVRETVCKSKVVSI